jgi:hypothetical protein
LLATRDAVRDAEADDDGAFMRRLLPILAGATQLIGLRRASADALNSAGSLLVRFLAALDNVAGSIRALHVAPRSPVIQTPGAMIKDGCGTPAIMNVWRHIGVVRVEAIRAVLEADVSAEELADHPEIVAWRAEQAEMPAFDDAALHGAAREIERQRERSGYPAAV